MVPTSPQSGHYCTCTLASRSNDRSNQNLKQYCNHYFKNPFYTVNIESTERECDYQWDFFMINTVYSITRPLWSSRNKEFRAGELRETCCSITRPLGSSRNEEFRASELHVTSQNDEAFLRLFTLELASLELLFSWNFISIEINCKEWLTHSMLVKISVWSTSYRSSRACSAINTA